MKKSEVNMCFVTDKGYLMPTCVALISAFENKKTNSIYNVYLLYRGLNDSEKQKVIDLENKNINIILVDLDKYEDFSNYKLNNVHATPTSIYKFFIPEILPKLDKVLFLDGDIIVQNDLTELYNTDLKDDYAAAVKDNNGLDRGIYEYSYFNSGVMLLNLKKMREDNTKDQMLDYRKNGINKLMDQDTFNYVFNKKVLLLPFKYNTQTNVLSAIVQKRKNYNNSSVGKYWNIDINDNSCDMTNELLFDAVVIHYASIKPWRYYDGFGSSIWYRYYNMSSYSDVKLCLQSHYIADMANSSSYRIGKVIIAPIVILKRLKTAISKRRYNNFLLMFSSRGKEKIDKLEKA